MPSGRADATQEWANAVNRSAEDRRATRWSWNSRAAGAVLASWRRGCFGVFGGTDNSLGDGRGHVRVGRHSGCICFFDSHASTRSRLDSNMDDSRVHVGCHVACIILHRGFILCTNDVPSLVLEGGAFVAVDVVQEMNAAVAHSPYLCPIHVLVFRVPKEPR